MFVKPISVYFITNSSGCPQEFTKAETFFLNFQILRFFLEKIEFLRRISLFFPLECLEYFLYHFWINAYPALLAKAQCSKYLRYFPPKA